jgi:nicotinamide riboside kinase
MGTQGTGKSTLVDMFLKDNPHYNRSFNIQRILNSKYSLGINTEGTFETQYAISAHYACEVCVYDDYISDRTIIDTFVYGKTCPLITKEEMKFIEDTFIKAIEFYHVIFYLDIEFVPPEDGVRVTNDSYRQQVNTLMKEYKESHTKKIIQLVGSVEERYNKINETLKHINENI